MFRMGFVAWSLPYKLFAGLSSKPVRHYSSSKISDNVEHTRPREVIILGAGLMGVTSAYYLSMFPNIKVTVIESCDRPAAGTSHANAGLQSPSIIAPHTSPGDIVHGLKTLFSLGDAYITHSWSLYKWGLRWLSQCTQSNFDKNSKILHELSTYSSKLMRQVMSEHPDTGHTKQEGLLTVYDSPKRQAWGEQNANEMRALGEVVHTLSPVELLNIEPALKQSVDSGLIIGAHYAPDNFSSNSLFFTHALATECEKRGVTFHFSTCVDSLVGDAANLSGVRVRSKDQDKSEVLVADDYVVCLGPWTTNVLEKSGISSHCTPLLPMKGHSITYKLPVNNTHAVPKHPIIFMTKEMTDGCITPMGDCVRVTMGEDFQGMNLQLNEERLNLLQEIGKQFYPQFGWQMTAPDDAATPVWDERTTSPIERLPNSLSSDSILRSGWTGLRAMTPDNVPIISKYPGMSNLWLNTGQGAMGYTNACASGKVLADLLTDSPTEVDVTPFDAARFTKFFP